MSAATVIGKEGEKLITAFAIGPRALSAFSSRGFQNFSFLFSARLRSFLEDSEALISHLV